MNRRWLWTLAVIVFTYTLVMRAPLAVLFAHFKPADSSVDVIGIEGDIHQGSAAGLLIGGQTALRDLRWTMQPWSLLLGRAAFDIEGGADGLRIDGRIAQTVTGRTRITDFRASGSIKPLLSAFKLYLPIDGTLGLDVQKLVMHNGLPTTAEGHVALDSLAWKLGRDPIVIGDFVADVTPNDDGINAAIKSVRGPLEVSGDAQLHADHGYELNLQIHAKSDAPPPLVNMLAGLGAPDNQGAYHIHRVGQLGPPASAAPASGVPAGAAQ